MELSVLVVNWNTRELTLRCLDTLPGGVGAGVEYETIVVDNGSVDGSAPALERRSDVTFISNEANIGFAAAVNQAYRRSRGALVLLLNSDVELPAGSISSLLELLHERPDLAGAAPLYRNPDGSAQPFHFRLPTFVDMLANGSAALRRLPGMERRLRHYRMLDEDFSCPRPVPQPSASCLLLRRTCLPADEVFDERYPIFFNDVQLARSLARSGHELWVTPNSTVVHEGHASTRQLGGALKRHYLASLIRMLEETEPFRNVLVYRAIVLTQGLAVLALRRPGALGLRDLFRTVAGDTGPLPVAPAAG